MDLRPLLQPASFGLLLALSPLHAVLAQQVPTPAPADTLHKYERPATGLAAVEKKSFFQSKGFWASVVPAVLIGYGISTIHGHGFYSSYDAKRDINHLFGPGRHTHVDDYLQFAPYLELGGVLLAGVESRNDRVNLGLIILKSELIMATSVFIVKYATNIDRPDGTPTAFPSGPRRRRFWPPASCVPSCAAKASGTASGPTPLPPAWPPCA